MEIHVAHVAAGFFLQRGQRHQVILVELAVEVRQRRLDVAPLLRVRGTPARQLESFELLNQLIGTGLQGHRLPDGEALRFAAAAVHGIRLIPAQEARRVVGRERCGFRAAGTLRGRRRVRLSGQRQQRFLGWGSCLT